MKSTSRIALIAVVLLSPFSAFALEAGVHTAVTGEVGAKPRLTASTSAQFETRAKARADQEIDRRVKNLQELSKRISEMKRLTSSQKSVFAASIQAQIDALTTLKAKIDAETDLTALKTEIQSITKEYRIYMLIMPQIHIAAAADRIETAVAPGGMLDSMSIKLKTRLDAATTTPEVGKLRALYEEMKAKMTEAHTAATAAVTVTASLKPDNGDATVAASNKVALEDGRAKIRAAIKALNTAVADMHKLIAALRGKGGDTSLKAHATTTP